MPSWLGYLSLLTKILSFPKKFPSSPSQSKNFAIPLKKSRNKILFSVNQRFGSKNLGSMPEKGSKSPV